MTDAGYAPERWEFDEEVTRVFGDMLDRSIPELATMRALATDLATAFAREGTTIADLGCSRGDALALVREKLAGDDLSFVGIEASVPMHAAAAERFAGDRRVEIILGDLRNHALPFRRYSVSLLVLTLMFVPVDHRARILRDLRLATVPGGAVILVEKTIAASRELDDVLVANYYRHKGAMGYGPDEIEAKRLSLEGQLVPLRAAWNEDLLRSAGWSDLDVFWAWGPFRAWVARAT